MMGRGGRAALLNGTRPELRLAVHAMPALRTCRAAALRLLLATLLLVIASVLSPLLAAAV